MSTTTFTGEFECTIDGKGRIILPASFKRQLSAGAQNRFVVKMDIYENCLSLYAYDQWMHLIELLKKKLNPYNKKGAQILRDFLKGAHEMELDANNRLMVPKRLYEKIGANRELMLAANVDRIEIWNKADYKFDVENPVDLQNAVEDTFGNSINGWDE